MRFKLFYQLNEATGEEIYKYFASIPRKEYDEIVKADPTSIIDGEEIKKVGTYSKWLLGLYKSKNLKLEDLYKATDYLKIYDKNKTKLEQKYRDINSIKSLPELSVAIEPVRDIKTKGDLEKVYDVKKNEYVLFYEDDKCLVVIPKTKEASCHFGNGTKWCTAARSNRNKFDAYTVNGEHLFIIIDKKTPKEKYQFGVPSQELKNNKNMYEEDDDIIIKKYPRFLQKLLDYSKRYFKTDVAFIPLVSKEIIKNTFERDREFRDGFLKLSEKSPQITKYVPPESIAHIFKKDEEFRNQIAKNADKLFHVIRPIPDEILGMYFEEDEEFRNQYMKSSERNFFIVYHIPEEILVKFFEKDENVRKSSLKISKKHEQILKNFPTELLRKYGVEKK